MSAKSTRSSKRRVSSSPALENDDEPEPEQQQQEQQQPARKKRPRGTPGQGAAPTAAAAADEDEQQQAAAPQAPARLALPLVHFSQQEAAKMTEAIAAAEEAAAEAREKLVDLGVAQTAVDALTAKVVRFLLFKAHEKPDVPVKRQELVELLQKDQRGARAAKKLPALVLPLAAAKLASAFGLEMKELARQPAGAAAAARKPAAAAAAAAAGGAAGSDAAQPAAGGGGGGASTQTYVLRSLLPSALHTFFVQDKADDCARGLTTVVLGLLQLNGGAMEAEELWRHLAQLGVDQQETHNVFGRRGAQEVLASMERARYLVSRREQNPALGGLTTTFSWGERATEEFGGHQLKQFVDQVLAAGGRAGGGDEEGGEAVE